MNRLRCGRISESTQPSRCIGTTCLAASFAYVHEGPWLIAWDPTGVRRGTRTLDQHDSNGLKPEGADMLASRADMGGGPRMCRWEPIPTTRVIGVTLLFLSRL